MPTIPLGAGAYDPDQRTIHGREGRVELSPIEGRLLDYLLRHPGRTVTHAELLREVWGYADGVQSRTVYATVDRLRKKIEVDPSKPRHVLNRARVGYRFELEAPPGSPDLVGRALELQRLREALAPGRLLTLTGTGGSGKTRLAHELVALAGAGGWSVATCAVASARSEADLVGAVSGALGVPLGDGDAAGQVGRALQRRGRLLLVLDNLEQVAAAAAALLVRWRREAPELCVVATSRILLGVPDEEAHELGPLALPAPGAGEEAVDRSAAVLLLKRRAEAARPGIVAAPESWARVARAVGGIPLGLELAAARLRVLDVAALAARLETDLGLLRDPGRLERQSSLSELVAWSWALLSETERRVLAQAAVFAAPFDVDLAEAVISGPGVLDALEALLDHHLLRRVEGEVPRLEPYEVVRAFLAEAGGPHEALAGRYARALVARGPGPHVRALDLADGGRTWGVLRADLPHLLTAARLAARSHPAEAARCVLHAWQVLEQQGPAAAAIDAMRALDPALLPRELAFELGHALVSATWSLGRVQEARHHLQALEPVLPLERAMIGLRRGLQAWRLGAPEDARTWLAEAGEDAAEAGDPVLRARVLAEQGGLLLSLGDGVAARAALEEARLLLPEGAGTMARLVVDALLARLLIQQGQPGRAAEIQAGILSSCRELGLRRMLPTALESLAYVRQAAGDREGARAALRDALREGEDQGLVVETWITRRALGWLDHLGGDPAAARAWLEGAARGAREAGDPAREALALWRLAAVERSAGDRVRARLLLDRALGQWPAGRFPVERARAGIVGGHLALDAGDPEGARLAMAEAEARLARRSPGWDPELEAEAAALRSAIRL